MRLNQVLFTGRLGKDPFCVKSNGSFLVHLNVAEDISTDRVYWHKFIVLGCAAQEIAEEKKLKKGDLVFIEGALETLGGIRNDRAVASTVRVNSVLRLAESRRKSFKEAVETVETTVFA